MNRFQIIQSSVTTAVRRLIRDRGVVSVNVIGLAIALAAVVVLGLFAQFEMSFDAFHDGADQIYRLGEERVTPSGRRVMARTRMPAMPTLVDEVPEVEVGTRLLQFGSLWLEGTASAQQVTPHYADSTFTEVFDFPVKVGDLRSTLAQPGRIALTASLAQQLFGTTDAVGRTVRVDFGEREYEVGAVMADPPPNSTVRFEAIIGWITQKEGLERYGGWYNTGTTAYVRLQDGVEPRQIESKLSAFSQRHFVQREDETAVQTLRPLLEERSRATNSSMLLKMLAGIAVAVLLVAGINFTNLTTARGLDRMSEVGMRRAMGASRQELITQFLAESVLLALLSAGLMIGIVLLLLPSFNALLDTSLSLDLAHLPVVFGIALTVGGAVGLYPALYLTRGRLSDSLLGEFDRSSTGQTVRSVLVVGQFVVSVALVIGAVGVWMQIHHLKNQDPGFDKEHVLAMPITTAPFDSTGAAAGVLKSMQRRMERIPGVLKTSFTGTVPTRYARNYNTYAPAGGDGSTIRLRQETVGPNYFETLGVAIQEGEPFRPRSYTSGQEMIANGGIINAAAAEQIRALTGHERVVGMTLLAGGGGTQVPIVGVTRAFQNDTAVLETEPTIHYHGGRRFASYDYLAVRVASGTTGTVLSELRAEWASVFTTIPFDPFFLDEELDELYETQEEIGVLAGLAAFLAVTIACLGILSLSAFHVKKRLKEISVRKVLGASTWSIVHLISRTIAGWTLIAVVIAVPVAYVGLERWLADFATRFEPGPLLFVGSSLLVLMLAVTTVGVQALRASQSDPATVLRRE